MEVCTVACGLLQFACKGQCNSKVIGPVVTLLTLLYGISLVWFDIRTYIPLTKLSKFLLVFTCWKYVHYSAQLMLHKDDMTFVWECYKWVQPRDGHRLSLVTRVFPEPSPAKMSYYARFFPGISVIWRGYCVTSGVFLLLWWITCLVRSPRSGEAATRCQQQRPVRQQEQSEYFYSDWFYVLWSNSELKHWGWRGQVSAVHLLQ